MNHRAHTETSEAAGGQAAEGTGGCSATQGSSAEGTTEALDG